MFKSNEFYNVYMHPSKARIYTSQALQAGIKEHCENDPSLHFHLQILSSIQLGEIIEPIELTEELEEKFPLFEEMLWIFARATGPIQLELL